MLWNTELTAATAVLLAYELQWMFWGEKTSASSNTTYLTSNKKKSEFAKDVASVEAKLTEAKKTKWRECFHSTDEKKEKKKITIPRYMLNGLIILRCD